MKLMIMVIALAGCASAYPNTSPPRQSTLSPAAAFDCVQAKVLALGYVVQDASRDAGFIRAKTPKPTGMRLDGVPAFDEISVSISKDLSGRITLTVTANNKEDATSVLTACAS